MASRDHDPTTGDAQQRPAKAANRTPRIISLLLGGGHEIDVAREVGVSRQRVNVIAMKLREEGHVLHYKPRGTDVTRRRVAAARERAERRHKVHAEIARLRAVGLLNREIVERLGVGRGLVSHVVHKGRLRRGGSPLATKTVVDDTSGTSTSPTKTGDRG